MNMTTSIIRKQLHAFIDIADKTKLDAIYNLIFDTNASYELSDDDKAQLDDLKLLHQSKKMKSFNLKEVRKHVKS